MPSARVPIGLFAACALTAILGCQSSPPPPGPAALTPGTLDAQVALGATVFADRCAGCHGSSGRGRFAPAIVGEDALPLTPRRGSDRAVEFRTAMDVEGFVARNMPPSALRRERITESDDWAIVAFILDASGVPLARPLGADNAAGVVLHPVLHPVPHP